MKFVISRLHLLNGLNTAARAVSPKNPNPLLTGLRLVLTSQGLSITGSDSDVTIVTFIPVTHLGENIIRITEEGSALVSSKYITEVVRKLEGEKLEITLFESSVLKIGDTSSDYNLNVMKEEDYPPVDQKIDGQVIELKTEDLRSIINQTVFAASQKDARPILTGINFRCVDNKLECVATDSYRLAKKTVTVATSANFNVTLPAKSLADLGKIIDGVDSVEMGISDKKVVVRMPFTNISTRVLSGTYPDTSKLIPAVFENELNTLSQNLIAAVDRAALLSTERQNVVKLSLSKDKVEVSAKSHEIGSYLEHISHFTYNGSRLDVSFTAGLLADAVRALGTEEVTIKLNGDMKPFVIVSREDDSVVHLVLPVRTY